MVCSTLIEAFGDGAARELLIAPVTGITTD